MSSEIVITSNPPPSSTITTKNPKGHKETMMAVEWHGNTEIRVNHKRTKPSIIKQTDAIVHVTASTICGSDLHLYHKEFPGMQKGDVMGHEAIGIVKEVGKHVNSINIGDRVVISAVISCGSCEYCKKGLFSCCDVTNISKEMEEIYGHHIAGIFGYSHLTGGYDGCQAEYVRVPYANVNLLALSIDDYRLLGRKSLLLADVACTGWHANELGSVKQDDVVGIWGAGPIGLMSAAIAIYRRASQVYVIDCIQDRLAFAKEIGAEVINFKEKDVVESVKKEIPNGFDVTIDAVGFRYTNKSWRHKLERALFAETDSVEALDEAIRCTKKGGVVSIVGDYVNMANRFPIGASMEKHLTLRGGQVHPQKYWFDVLPILRADDIFDKFFTHNMSLSEAPKAYKKFDRKEDGVIKVFLIVDDKEFVNGRIVGEVVDQVASASMITQITTGTGRIEIVENETVTFKSIPSSSIGGVNVKGKKLTEGNDSKVPAVTYHGKGNEAKKGEGVTATTKNNDLTRDAETADTKTGENVVASDRKTREGGKNKPDELHSAVESGNVKNKVPSHDKDQTKGEHVKSKNS